MGEMMQPQGAVYVQLPSGERQQWQLVRMEGGEINQCRRRLAEAMSTINTKQRRSNRVAACFANLPATLLMTPHSLVAQHRDP